MAFGRTQDPEQQAVKQAAREEKAEQKAAAKHAETPVGKAELAHARGDRLFEVQFKVQEATRDVAIGGSDVGMRYREYSSAYVLGQIEAVGWTLAHVGYTFVATSESSRDKFLASGQHVGISGYTLGFYMFRRCEA